MAYPDQVILKLQNVNGNSCGVLHHLLEMVENSDPPEYWDVPGQGPFDFAMLYQITLSGGAKSWEVEFRYRNPSHACHGTFWGRRTPAADDPTGTFCDVQGGCSVMQAQVDPA